MIVIANPLIKAEPNTSYITFGVIALRPFSRGNVHVSKSDPTAYPSIDHNFLSFDFGPLFQFRLSID
jgi:hypothetical protein